MTINGLTTRKYFFTDSKKQLPYLDVEILLAQSIGKNRTFILSNPDYILTKQEQQKFNQLLKRRQLYEPIAYMTGSKEFLGYDFIVNKHTLIPRPETELLVEECLRVIKTIKNETIRILEIGTGTGCIPISIVLEGRKLFPNKSIVVDSIDISIKALKIAQKNIEAYRLSNNIKTYNLDVCDTKLEHKLPHPIYDIIISNPPYIPTNEINSLQPDVKDFEPINALDGGKDGLKFYKCILENTKNIISDKTIYLFELHSKFTDKNLAEIIENKREKRTVIKDLSGKKRVLKLS